ncbi:hypothetical protein A2Y99_00230 [Candidatus Gottesmanbacteria bacterium RBG_13_37_7]|uniref:Uncharacterized protein n=1 Tax=Candidatus Gottesmanbacteria bacterium RBG_13_37_7 TaxID=1798369 RepID=A0A1F5YGY7_9BACT|nr:MAG: hypothetical protein A2Y99_00230 [Candidatus Gottesmanbacteria bacterium RBG_13_37_7]
MFLISSAVMIKSMNTRLAQEVRLPDGTTVIKGPIDPTRFPNLASVINNAQPYIFAIAGVMLLALLIAGGFGYLTSAGDPKKAASAQKRITNALLGFLIIFVAYWLVVIIDYIFKLGIYN